MFVKRDPRLSEAVEVTPEPIAAGCTLESLRLATDLNADIVLIDEQEGRQLASNAGLAVTGVLGILLRAKRSGEIAAVKPEMDLLRSKANFFVSSALEGKILRAAGE